MDEQLFCRSKESLPLMMMSQGTSTFFICFAVFWLIWVSVVMFCCFCSFLLRCLKTTRHQRLREAEHVGAEPVGTQFPSHPQPLTTDGPPPPDLVRVLHPTPQDATIQPSAVLDSCGKPPCYEEAVLMEAPPPAYSQVMGDALKPLQNVPEVMAFQERRGFSSLGHLPSSLLSNHSLTLPLGEWPPQAAVTLATVPYREWKTLNPRMGSQTTAGGPQRGLQSRLRSSGGGFRSSCGTPTAFLMLGRSTAV
ncbi:proline-rich protein 7 [Gouania willdenowi]|uniref:Uncharacterized protein n=1 Tax=Gouania willdenowi TaxID=441366 RepID=A0A8C5ENG7_GOUWI|nr:proline-rich protein 7 [Gouania willdenowi]